MTDLAVDTSVAVPYVMASHEAHDVARRYLSGRRPALTGHSLAEAYSILTRLPGDARVAPDDAVRLIDANFAPPALLPPELATTVPSVLAAAGVAGGAVYDALVALAAREAGLPLATRDKRAVSTYVALGCAVELVG